MKEEGRITLYLTYKFVDHEHFTYFSRELYDGKLTNWPGTLCYKATSIRKGHHNIAGSRVDVWFVGPDKHVWHGAQYGDNTQLCHCRRTKRVAW